MTRLANATVVNVILETARVIITNHIIATFTNMNRSINLARLEGITVANQQIIKNINKLAATSVTTRHQISKVFEYTRQAIITTGTKISRQIGKIVKPIIQTSFLMLPRTINASRNIIVTTTQITTKQVSKTFSKQISSSTKIIKSGLKNVLGNIIITTKKSPITIGTIRQSPIIVSNGTKKLINRVLSIKSVTATFIALKNTVKSFKATINSTVTGRPKTGKNPNTVLYANTHITKTPNAILKAITYAYVTTFKKTRVVGYINDGFTVVVRSQIVTQFNAYFQKFKASVVETANTINVGAITMIIGAANTINKRVLNPIQQIFVK
jgi:alkylated DNA nucleotide flippase Atl1